MGEPIELVDPIVEIFRIGVIVGKIVGLGRSPR